MAGSMRQTIISALRDLAPRCSVGRIWGRLEGATPEQAQEGNAWAADPEDIADLLLKVITDRLRDEIGVDNCSCGGCDTCSQHGLVPTQREGVAVVHLGPLTHLEIGGSDVTAYIRTDPTAAQLTCTATLDHADYGLIRCDQEHLGTYHCGPIPGPIPGAGAIEGTLANRCSWPDTDPGATPHRTPPVTEPDEATVCHAYVPPTGKPEDSGCCAQCGMYDWRHTGPAPDDIAAWLKDPANHQAVAVVLRAEVRRDRNWWEQELRRLARVHGDLDRFAGRP